MSSKEQVQEFSYKNLFVPLTTNKVIIFVTIIGFIVFFNMLLNGFVWDDNGYIIFNNDIHSINILNLLKQNSFNANGLYRPIAAIYFAFLYKIFFNNSFFYHIIQLIIHIGNSLLVYILLGKFLNRKISFFLSLLFLVHPMQVESVSYIASSENLLFFLFGIIAFFLAIKNSLNLKTLIMITSLLVFSFLSKETGILFLPLILFYRYLYKIGKTIKIFICGVLAILFYLVLRIGFAKLFIGSLSSKIIPIASLSLGLRLLNVPLIFFYYIKTFFFPTNLVIDQLWVVRKIDFYNFYAPLFMDILVIIAITTIGAYLYKSRREIFKKYVFFLLWFFMGIALYLQIFSLDLTVSDKWFYFPIVGLLGMLGIIMESVKIRIQIIKKTILLLGILFLVFLSIRTITRNLDWTSGLTLYDHDAQIEDNYDLQNNLGEELARINDYNDALSHFIQSVNYFPYEVNLYNLGATYETLGNFQEALEYYHKAINTNLSLPPTHKRVIQLANEGIDRINTH